MTDLPVVDPTTGDIDPDEVVAAIRELHRPTLETVEWFHDQNGKGEALCCPSCRPKDPTEWHPEVGKAGIEPEGFVPAYVLSPCPTLVALAGVDRLAEPGDADAIAELSRLLDEARTQRDAAVARRESMYEVVDGLSLALDAATLRLAAYQELETAARAWANPTRVVLAATGNLTSVSAALVAAVDALPEGPASPPGSTLSDEQADTGAASTPDVQAATGTTEAPLLGLATTRQLLEEIKARGEVEAAVGYYTATAEAMAIGAANLLDSLPGSMLSYRTVDEPPTHTEERDGN